MFMVNNHPTPRVEPEGIATKNPRLVVYTENKVAYRKHHFTTSCGI